MSVEEEMARTLGDLLWRRFEVGWSACEGLDMLDSASEVMAYLLGWSESERSHQMQSYREEVASNHRWGHGSS